MATYPALRQPLQASAALPGGYHWNELALEVPAAYPPQPEPHSRESRQTLLEPVVRAAAR